MLVWMTAGQASVGGENGGFSPGLPCTTSNMDHSCWDEWDLPLPPPPSF